MKFSQIGKKSARGKEKQPPKKGISFNLYETLVQGKPSYCDEYLNSSYLERDRGAAVAWEGPRGMNLENLKYSIDSLG